MEQLSKEMAKKAILALEDKKEVKADDLLKYDTIIYGGGLYAEIINGVSLITKNYEHKDVIQRKKHGEVSAFQALTATISA